MAGDCPHHHQFQTTLKYCHEQTALITATHDSYMQFIDDLKNDLDNLSCQVSLVQQQFSEELPVAQEVDCKSPDDASSRLLFHSPRSVVEFKSAHSALETQNELLHQTLEQMERQQLESRTELQKNTDSFKCQIDQMQRTIYEKENRIKQLNSMLTRLSHIRMESQVPEEQQQQQKDHRDQQECELVQMRSMLEQLKSKNESLLHELERSQKQERFLINETRKLNDELVQSKKRNCDIQVKAQRLASLLKTQETHRMDLTKKYEMMEENYEQQAKRLRCANLQINQLQERFSQMEKRDNEHNMERNLLREEVLALKEKEATMLGKQRSVQEQMMKIEKELFNAHDVIKEQQCILQRNDFAHSEVVKRLQEARNDTKRQFNMVVEDYNKLQEEYEKQNELRRQNEKVIESFRKWKEAQIKSDEATRASFKQYEEHIRLLLEEKQRFLEKYRELNRDYCVMQGEVDRLRAYSAAAPGNNSENSISNRMELIRRTARRVSQQSASLRAQDTSPGLRISRSKSAQHLF